MSFNGLSGDQAQIVRVAAAYAVRLEDDVLLCDSSGGAFAITLPAVPTDGIVYRFKDAGGAATANNITINASGGKAIDGGTHITITGNYGRAAVLYSVAFGKWLLIENLAAVVA